MQVSQEVLKVLSGAEFDGQHLRIRGQLGRSLYTQVDKVVVAAGGAWNRKAKAHVFDGVAEDAIDQVLLTGEVTRAHDFGFFQSTAPVVERLMLRANVKEGMSALEPSAGHGVIAYALVKAGADVTCVELIDKNRVVLTAAGFNLVPEPDFLKVAPAVFERRFDRIVMNPPFAKRADIIHVTHALKFLDDEGILVAVMSAGVEFREDKLATTFRELVDTRGGYIERLPEGSFKASGTSVNTAVVTIPGSP